MFGAKSERGSLVREDKLLILENHPREDEGELLARVDEEKGRPTSAKKKIICGM